MINDYRKILIIKVELTVTNVPIRVYASLRIVPDKKSDLAEIRFWYNDSLVSIQK